MQTFKSISMESFIDMYSHLPKFVRNVSELAYLPLRDGDVVIRVKHNNISSGYSIFYVMPTPKECKLNMIELDNGLSAIELPPMYLDIDKLDGEYHIPSSKYLENLEKTLFLKDNVIGNLKDSDPNKVHNSVCTALMNTKLEAIMQSMLNITFCNPDGTVIDNSSVMHKKAIIQLSFNKGNKEIVIKREGVFKEISIQETKLVKAYLTSKPADNIFPDLVPIVDGDKITVYPIVNNKQYTVSEPFTANLEIAFDFKKRIIQDKK